MKDKIWTRADLVSGGLTGLVAMAVYFWTAAPNVTLLDSGEFIVAAQHFGVPHPTGYPLWTLLAWLFQLLPFGNAAWEINLFSGFCGGLAVGLSTALTRSTLRWLLGEKLEAWRGLTTLIAVTCGLLFAFSASMWSQATIAEVYTLHALTMGSYLCALYAWLRRPERLGLLILSFFLLTLAFSNHHLSVSLAPLPFLAVLLVRRELFWDLLIASLLTALLAFLGFAILSADPVILKTAIRFFYFVMLGFLILVIVRRGNLEWRLVAYLPFIVAIGLLPYAYMPLASSTNPPMNWAYTRTPEGFFFSFNRSQYSGSLTQQSLRSLGRLVGTAPESIDNPDPRKARPESRKSLLSRLQDWTGFFWLQLARSFTPFGVIAYFAALLVILRVGDVRQRTWVYTLEIAFVLAAILQPVADGAEIDVSGWWLQMPYHTYTNLIFSLLAAIGMSVGIIWLLRRYPRLAPARSALIGLILLPLWLNYDSCTQRGRWFGWQFGHDILKDLPKNAVFLGGTDPGRFVPTYMIFGESGQPASLKRDPAFDRRDLFVITQNGVGEPLYRKYLADHYGENRPLPKNAWERWLGRAETYPKPTLIFPTEDEIQEAIQKGLKENTDPDPSLPHSVVTRLIWEKNKGRHPFFVEESFPLIWSYDHAVPHGLVYEILPEPVKEIPREAVEKDMAFWSKYTEALLANPEFAKDYDAQRSFSKLRSSLGNLYLHRKMEKEAEIAYRQALLLWTGNPESLSNLNSLLWKRGDFDDYIALVAQANTADPNNMLLWRLRAMAEKRKEVDGEIRGLVQTLKTNPADGSAAEKLVELYSSVGQTNLMADLVTTSSKSLATNADFLKKAAIFCEANEMTDAQMAAAKALADLKDSNGDHQTFLARAAIAKNDRPLFFEAMKSAIQTGGLPVRDAFEKSPLLNKWKDDPEYQKILKGDFSPPETPSAQSASDAATSKAK